jgi:uncharacterized protein (TIGR04255 family)
VSSVTSALSSIDLDEVFPHPPLREVAFEIRFATRFRVSSELFKLQDRLVEQYPEAGTESVLQPNGTSFQLQVFQNLEAGRVIKVSQNNFALAFTKYRRFEDFKDEILAKTELFCSTFGIASIERIGLRYVNNIALSGSDPHLLLRYVRPFIDFERISVESVQQFFNELVYTYDNHMVTVRSVLMLERVRTYVLDIDCHSDQKRSVDSLGDVVDHFHNSAQRIFLSHVTDEFKQVMRGKAK